MDESQESTGVLVTAWAGAFVGGLCLAVQSRFNGTLGAGASEPVVAAVWSLGSGLVLLTLCVAALPFRRALRDLAAAIRERRLRWWECLGGVAGGLFVAVQASVVSMVGVAIFTVATVGGQAVAGMLVDHYGIGPRGRSQMTGARLVAAVLAVVGVAITVSARSSGGAGFALAPVVLVIVIGGLTQVQQGLNGRVTQRVGSPYATTWQNFAVGLVTLVLVTGARLVSGVSRVGLPHGVPWWSWLGAPLGIVFIGVSAWATRHIGVLVLGLIALVGQLVSALALDLLDPATRGLVGGRMLGGMAVTAFAAGAAAYAGARSTRRSGRRRAAAVPSTSGRMDS